MASKRSAKTPPGAKDGSDKQRPTIVIAERNARLRPEFTVRLAKARREISGSLSRAMLETKCSQSAAARSMAVAERTVRDWVHGVTPTNVERVLASPRLAKAFRDSLCSYDHGHATAPYILKKRRRDK